jgi:hypothetical protein
MSIYLRAARVAWQAFVVDRPTLPECVSLGCIGIAMYEPLTFTGESFIPMNEDQRKLLLNTRCADCAHKGHPVKCLRGRDDNHSDLPIVEEKEEETNKRPRSDSIPDPPRYRVVIVVITGDRNPWVYDLDWKELKEHVPDGDAEKWQTLIREQEIDPEGCPWKEVKRVALAMTYHAKISIGWGNDTYIGACDHYVIRSLTLIHGRVYD